MSSTEELENCDEEHGYFELIITPIKQPNKNGDYFYTCNDHYTSLASNHSCSIKECNCDSEQKDCCQRDKDGKCVDGCDKKQPKNNDGFKVCQFGCGIDTEKRGDGQYDVCPKCGR